MSEIDSLERPNNVFKMNMGSDDNPVWVWAKYDHNLNVKNVEYDHIYGINYYDDEGYSETLYYEKDRDGKSRDIIDFSDYIIKPYPGNGTLQIIGKSSDTLLLFNVLENKDLSRVFKGKKYRRIPTVNINSKNEKVSNYDVRISYDLKEKPFYEITIIDDEGVNTFVFKSNCDLNNDFVISYYDLANSRVYLLEKDCYLEEVGNGTDW